MKVFRHEQRLAHCAVILPASMEHGGGLPFLDLVL